MTTCVVWRYSELVRSRISSSGENLHWMWLRNNDSSSLAMTQVGTWPDVSQPTHLYLSGAILCNTMGCVVRQKTSMCCSIVCVIRSILVLFKVYSVLCSILYSAYLCSHLDRQEILCYYTATATQLHSHIVPVCTPTINNTDFECSHNLDYNILILSKPQEGFG